MITSWGAGGRRSKWTNGAKYMRGSQGEGGCILLAPSFHHFDSLCCIADSGVSAYSRPCFIGSSNNAYMNVKSLQSCLTLCNSVACQSVHGILQEKILEWVALPSSGGFS